MAKSSNKRSQGRAGATPTQFRIRAYQVGFGDCFLLTFTYAKEKKNILLDFGTVRLPAGVPKNQLQLIAADIKKECAGKGLTAVIVTHRHRDHISGFSTQGGTESSGSIIRSLKPKMVLQPWTENPDAPLGAISAPVHQAFQQMLFNMQAVSAQIYAEAQSLDKRYWQGFSGELGFAGENNLKNKSAVLNLQGMAPKKSHEYLHCGAATSLSSLLPGVNVHVIGPPTVQQSSAIKKERSSDPDEFWMLTKSTFAAPLAPVRKSGKAWKTSAVPPSVRWFVKRADAVRQDQLLGLVRVLDKAMNNTSLILVFEIGGRRFLFPGDAQIENWSYALFGKDKNKYLPLLKDVEFYKVGHHGSRNATPKTMWNAVKKDKAGTLKTLVSTLDKVYGKDDKHTEVPRKTLMDELQKKSDLHTTLHQEGPQDIVIDL
jgi:beta-lactamase superfamily II metal-dependent hydrolase